MEIIHVRQILAELWPLTLRIFTHFSLSSQHLLHPCMDLNETWQGCCTTSLGIYGGDNSCSSNFAGVLIIRDKASTFGKCALLMIGLSSGNINFERVIVTFDLLLNIGNNFLTVRDLVFIFGIIMCSLCPYLSSGTY